MKVKRVQKLHKKKKGKKVALEDVEGSVLCDEKGMGKGDARVVLSEPRPPRSMLMT